MATLVLSVLGIPFKVANRSARTVARIPPLSWTVIFGRSILVHGVDGLSRVISRITKGPASSYVFMQGTSAPQHEETVVHQAKVSGTIPEGLYGMFATIGANPQFAPLGGYHPFEGDGSVITVRIRSDGSASFAYTHLETEKLAYERKMGRSSMLSVHALEGFSGLFLVLLTAIRKSLTKGMFFDSWANTNIEEHGGKLFALMETRLPYELGLSKDGLEENLGFMMQL